MTGSQADNIKGTNLTRINGICDFKGRFFELGFSKFIDLLQRMILTVNNHAPILTRFLIILVVPI